MISQMLPLETEFMNYLPPRMPSSVPAFLNGTQNAVCFDYRLRGTQCKSAILLIKLGYQINGI